MLGRYLCFSMNAVLGVVNKTVDQSCGYHGGFTYGGTKID
jgi:hypothetical protein